MVGDYDAFLELYTEEHDNWQILNAAEYMYLCEICCNRVVRQHNWQCDWYYKEMLNMIR